MSKRFVLHWYPSDDAGIYYRPGFDTSRSSDATVGDIEATPMTVATEVMRKRLSGPELAAEYWRAYSDLSSVVYDGWAGCWITSDELVETFERFATLPHYDEEPA